MTVVAETKVEIPEDVKQAADAVWEELASGLIGLKDMRHVETEIIARAILAERERCAKIAERLADNSEWRDEAIGAARLASSIRSGAKL